MKKSGKAVRKTSSPKTKVSGVEHLGIKPKLVHWNLNSSELAEHSLRRKEGELADNGALCAPTVPRTGRSPKDRFVVKDETTANTIWWGDVNIPVEEKIFDNLYRQVTKYLSGKELFARDAYAGADENYRLPIRIVNEFAWHNLFVKCLFLRPTSEQLKNHPETSSGQVKPEFTIIAAPNFKANPKKDGTRSEVFVILDFKKRIVLIGGTAYAGEMKKSIFAVMNYLMPQRNVFPMHCSANIGDKGDTAIFFGLSGTGKTTLSADPNRGLIGDDEHGWSEKGVFNFEGGCYAKCIDLTREKEPQIYDAIRFGSVLENIVFFPNTRTPDYADKSITENTRAAYPVEHISNAVIPGLGGIPQNIFFLTCDAFGVLPPISKLEKGQAMYHFISGYTAKVAGTEAGITEPTTTFSACFGSPFLPLHPTRYAEMLGEKMKKHNATVWLINTGWSGGSYGVGSRMKLSYTRAMITAALKGELNNVLFERDPVFGVLIPKTCSNVPSEILNPRNTWKDKDAYDRKANELAEKFNKNFEKYASFANEEILSAAPKVLEKVE